MSGLFFTGLSGLAVARAGLMTTAHNTANVQTPGYSRQTAVVRATQPLRTGAGFIGTGAAVATVVRSSDAYLTAQLRGAQSAAEALSSYANQLGRIDDLLADRASGLAPLMQSFFGGVQAVANTPADPAARQQMLSAAEGLAGRFRAIDQYLTDLGTSLNEQIEGHVRQINSYATQIADLNQKIGQLAGAGGQPPNDLLDQRDALVGALGAVVSVRVVQQDGGAFNLFIGQGQSLVLGERALQVTAVRSAADPSRLAVALAGFAGNAIEMKDELVTGGALGGILAFRNEALVSTQNAIGRIALVMAQAVNAQHRLGQDLAGRPGGDLFSVGTPTVLPRTGNSGDLALRTSLVDAGQLTGSDYAVQVRELEGVLRYEVTRLADGARLGPFAGWPATFDGLTIEAGGGMARAGDAFLIQPTRTGARDLAVLLGDPARIAAATPVVAAAAATNTGGATVRALRVDASYAHGPLADALTLRFDAATRTLTGFPAGGPVTVTSADGSVVLHPAGTPVPYVAGARIGFGGIELTLEGNPADGDSFTLEANRGGVSDGSNALLLGALQRALLVGEGAATLHGSYAQLVSSVGNRAMQVQVAHTTQTGLAEQIRVTQQSIAGVNQDEEAANLMLFQQMYQANAKAIQTASTIFDTILGIR